MNETFSTSASVRRYDLLDNANQRNAMFPAKERISPCGAGESKSVGSDPPISKILHVLGCWAYRDQLIFFSHHGYQKVLDLD